MSNDGEDEILTLRSVVQDIAFGSVAGMTSELFEYPFDLAKVRLQSQLLHSSQSVVRFDGPWDCLKQTWTYEGLKGLYRGLPVPLVGSMGETASVFLAYTAFRNIIQTYSQTRSKDKSILHPLTYTQLGIAASGAGFVTSFLLTPLELIKCQMQVQMVKQPHLIKPASPTSLHSSVKLPRPSQPPLPSANHYHSAASSSAPGPLAVLSETIQLNGFRGLWLGHTGTLIRETIGTAVWFVSKEAVAGWLLAQRISPSSHPSNSSLSESLLEPWESAVSGAISGGVSVLALYPADTVKSAIQTEPGSSSSSFLRTAKQIQAMHGWRGLYSGCGMTVMRAAPSSAIVFVVYDGLMRWFS